MQVRGRRRTLALVLVPLLVLAACSSKPPSDTVLAPPGNASGGGSSGGSTTYKVKFVPGTCPFERISKIKTDLKIECGKVRVPMDRAAPNDAQVELAVAVIRSPNPDKAPDPVVYLAGGPGGSALATIDLWLDPPFRTLDNRDLVLIDQRGTGYSSPRLWCAYDYKTAANETDDVAVLGKCTERLKRQGDVDFTRFGTKDAALDVVDVQRALQVKEWNLFGVSYGTRLALRVMAEHPEGIRSVVLDSTYAPGATFADVPADAGHAIRSVLQTCNGDPACRGKYGDIEQRLYRTIDKYNRSPIRYQAWDPDRGRIVERQFTGNDYVEELFGALYRTEAVPSVPASVAAADNGDPEGALEILYGDLLRKQPDEDDPGDSRDRPRMSDGLYLTVECPEDIPLWTMDDVRGKAADLNPSLAGGLIASSEELRARCDAWAKVEPNENPVVSAPIPTLVMAGTFDPITPPAWGQLAASTLPQATFLQFTGAGHGTFLAGECPLVKLNEFVNDPASGGGPPCDLAPTVFK